MTRRRRGQVFFDRQLAGWVVERDGGMAFWYAPEWLARPDAQPVSLALPLRSEPYEAAGLDPFFENLLPEGWLLSIASGASSWPAATASGSSSPCAGTASAR